VLRHLLRRLHAPGDPLDVKKFRVSSEKPPSSFEGGGFF
jgi:hypothetical protein